MYLKIWDVGGQHSLRRLWQSYYKSCHAIVFIVDSSDVGDSDLTYLSAAQNQQLRSGDSKAGSSDITEREEEMEEEANVEDDGTGSKHRGRLEECRLVLESVLASTDTTGVPVLVLANKQDREDCVETVRIKEGLVRPVFEGSKGGGIRDSRVLPISALTGTGVREAVEWVKSRVQWNKEGRPPVMR